MLAERSHAVASVLAGEVVDIDFAVVDSIMVPPPGSVVHLYSTRSDEVPRPSMSLGCIKTPTSSSSTSHYFLATMFGASSRRPRWCGCVANRDCPSDSARWLTAGVLLFTT